MASNDKQLLSTLNSLRDSMGWSQHDLGRALEISQGHISKVLAEKAAISRKLRVRIAALLSNQSPAKPNDRRIESDLILAFRRSPRFRTLVSAALEMHKNASK